MKKVIVCDSGLGGLNVAARFFSKEAQDGEPCDIVYFNAYPSMDCGFNDLPSKLSQEMMFRNVFEGMNAFKPDCCLIACNTLSVIYERLRAWFTPPFPVIGIIDTAVNGMAAALKEAPDASVLILGTNSTVESGVYSYRLAKQISAKRIRSLACPGLATRLEKDPAAQEIRASIAEYAQQAALLWKTPPKKLFLSLCCTHFEYATTFWLEEFKRVFGDEVSIVNPNELLAANICAKSFAYHSRIDFFPGAQQNICAYFKNVAPAISEALKNAKSESGLFNFEYKK